MAVVGRSPAVLHLSLVVGGELVDAHGLRLGRVEDLIVRLGGDHYPPVTGRRRSRVAAARSRLLQGRRADLRADDASLLRVSDRGDPREAGLGQCRVGDRRPARPAQLRLPVPADRARRHDDHAVHAALPPVSGRRARHRPGRAERRARRGGDRLDLREPRRLLHHHRDGATLYVHRDHTVDNAADAARALAPFAGRYAEVLFAIGLLGASLLAAAILPITAAYVIAETFGFEKGISHRPSDAPVFVGVISVLIAIGTIVALIPGVPVIQLLVGVQVVNGLLLPITLFFVCDSPQTAS